MNERAEEQKDNIEFFCYQIMISINEIKEILKEEREKKNNSVLLNRFFQASER
jgi:hypothetical protein